MPLIAARSGRLKLLQSQNVNLFFEREMVMRNKVIMLLFFLAEAIKGNISLTKQRIENTLCVRVCLCLRPNVKVWFKIVQLPPYLIYLRIRASNQLGSKSLLLTPKGKKGKKPYACLCGHFTFSGYCLVLPKWTQFRMMFMKMLVYCTAWWVKRTL